MVMGKFGLFSLISKKGSAKEHEHKVHVVSKQDVEVPKAKQVIVSVSGLLPATGVPDLAAGKEQEMVARELQADPCGKGWQAVSTSIALTLRNASDHARHDNIIADVHAAERADPSDDDSGSLGEQELRRSLHAHHAEQLASSTLGVYRDRFWDEQDRCGGGGDDDHHDRAFDQVGESQPVSPRGSDEPVDSARGSANGSQHSEVCSPYAASVGVFHASCVDDAEHGVPEHQSDPGVYFEADKETYRHQAADGGKGTTLEDKPSPVCRSEGDVFSEDREGTSPSIRRCRSGLAMSSLHNGIAETSASDPGRAPGSTNLSPRLSLRSADDIDGNAKAASARGESQSNSGGSCPADVALLQSGGITGAHALGYDAHLDSEVPVYPSLPLRRGPEEAGFMLRVSDFENSKELAEQWQFLSSKSAPDLQKFAALPSVQLYGENGKASTALITMPTKQNEVMKLAVALDSAGQSSMARVHDWVSRILIEDVAAPEDSQGEFGDLAYEEPGSPVALFDSRRSAPSQGSGHALAAGSTGDAVAVEAGTLGGGSTAAKDADVEYASRCARSLDRTAATVHLASKGLTVLPNFVPFHSLKSLHLAHNGIGRISAGSLPRSLHVLDLSHNSLYVIEGLRELTRLRVVNLSHNRISRIGHGLASCSSLRELYLGGNKVSEVEGLHRLLKLTVLDLAHNKVTSTKALGQLAANYGSMLALNLVGNPIHVNLGDDAFRRYVTGLLPHLLYLNQQPVKAASARDAATDGVARAALVRSNKATARSSARPASSSRRAGSSSHHRTASAGGSSGSLQPSRTQGALGSSGRSSSRPVDRSERQRRRVPGGSSSTREDPARTGSRRVSSRSLGSAGIVPSHRRQVSDLSLPVVDVPELSKTPDLKLGASLMRMPSLGLVHAGERST